MTSLAGIQASCRAHLIKVAAVESFPATRHITRFGPLQRRPRNFRAASCTRNQLHSSIASRFTARPSAAVRTDQSSPTKVHATAGESAQQDEVHVSFPETPLIVPYPHGEPSPVLISQHDSAGQVYAATADFIAKASQEAIKARGCFVLVLSGGSMVEALGPLALEPYLSQVEWEKWHVLWVDERAVAHTSNDSNFKQAALKLLSKVPIPEDQILPTDDEIRDVTEMAEDYEALLRELVEDKVVTTTRGKQFPVFDLILLGIGPDGHTASLFPNFPQVRDTAHWVLPVQNSPKPPPQRITMTLPTINAARKVAFVVTGEGKAETLQRILERPALPGSLPAQLIRPYKGTLTWFIDSAAASALSQGDWKDPKRFPAVKF